MTIHHLADLTAGSAATPFPESRPVVKAAFCHTERYSLVPNDFAFCYFIREPLAQCVKIGFAFNVRKRFDTLQASHPFPLAVLGFCPGGQRLERRLHNEIHGMEHLKKCVLLPQLLILGEISPCLAHEPNGGRCLIRAGERTEKGHDPEDILQVPILSIGFLLRHEQIDSSLGKKEVKVRACGKNGKGVR